jgi:hypothetical protein
MARSSVVDGKTPWPDMKLTDFRIDSRKKRLREPRGLRLHRRGWQIVPRAGGR